MASNHNKRRGNREGTARMSSTFPAISAPAGGDNMSMISDWRSLLSLASFFNNFHLLSLTSRLSRELNLTDLVHFPT